MASYISDDPKLLDELFRKDGEGCLLVGYETGKEKPHAESSYMLYPADPARQDPAYTFMALFHLQSAEAGRSAFIPDTRLEIYSFPKMTDVPAPAGDIAKKEYISRILLPYIREKGLVPLISTNLRNAIFAQGRSDIPMESGGLPKLTAEQLDGLIRFHREQDELAVRYNYNPVHKLPLHVVETSKGMLFFSDSELGRAGLRNYYQQLTDSYFSVHGESSPVREYSTSRITPDIHPFIDASHKMNPDTGIREFVFDPASFQKQDFDRKGWKFEFETSMEPNSDEFLLLKEHAHSRMSKHNNNVSKLLYLQEHGYSRDIVRAPSFEYAHVFRDLEERIDASINSTGKAVSPGEPSKNLFDLVEEVRQKAAGIIKSDYDIRGHRSFERAMKDLSYDPVIGDIRLSHPVRQALWEGKCVYLPEISASNPDLHYIRADKGHQKLSISATPFSRQIYREENGKIVPFQPAKAVSSKKGKTSNVKRSNKPKL